MTLNQRHRGLIDTANRFVNSCLQLYMYVFSKCYSKRSDRWGELGRKDGCSSHPPVSERQEEPSTHPQKVAISPCCVLIFELILPAELLCPVCVPRDDDQRQAASGVLEWYTPPPKPYARHKTKDNRPHVVACSDVPAHSAGCPWPCHLW